MKAYRYGLALSLVVVACVWAVFLSRDARSAVLMSRQEGQTVWDGVYSRTQADRGQVVFDRECARCHDVGDFVGEDYMTTWQGQTLREFYLYISSGMPPDLHEEITDFQTYADIVAYVLRSNDFPSGDRDLSSSLDRLDRVRIEPTP